MTLFQLLSNPVFAQTNVELYSLWIKKRILVYEYGLGLWGKIKLGLEPEQEEGALIYFTKKQDNALAQALDGLFLYGNKQSTQYTAVGIISRESTTEQDINVIFQTISQCDALPMTLIKWKLILCTSSYPAQALDWLKTLIPDVLITDYNNPPGRSAEDFIKD